MQQEELFQRLGFLFRKTRLARQLKAADLAVRCRISPDTLRAIEQGSHRVKIGSWYQVAQQLGLAASWLQLLNEALDPFEEYDRQLADQRKVLKGRVRTARGK